MEEISLAPVWLTLLAVAFLLVGDRTGRRGWEWISKPVAAAGFLWAAWSWGALESDYGQWVLVGLALSATGDVLLIPKGKSRWFLAGISAFLLGHVAYVIAFSTLPLALPAGLIAAAIMAAVAWGILHWLLPSVEGRLRIPVMAYIAVISAMVVMAVAAVAGGAHWALAVGALGFAASDLAVARNRFLAPGFVNRLWGLPLYFASQLLIAYTVSTTVS
ncbi:lysoplasmalogenase [Alkalilimnicola ehrlichii]|uniref:lysoplasmalogenase n=1 Tax=Alkalilimnicola ehrlichii TaxID=351052 RepID=UPI0015F24DE3|nr:lysoplasmalogenase [Alkalilimnicola ehrlichii]